MLFIQSGDCRFSSIYSDFIPAKGDEIVLCEKTGKREVTKVQWDFRKIRGSDSKMDTVVTIKTKPATVDPDANSSAQ